MILFSSRILLPLMCKYFSATAFPFLHSSSFLIEKLFTYAFYICVISRRDWSPLYSLKTFFLSSRHHLHYVNWLTLLVYFLKRTYSGVCHSPTTIHNDDDEKCRLKRNTTIPDLCQQSNKNLLAYIDRYLIALSFILSLLGITYIHTCIVS